MFARRPGFGRTNRRGIGSAVGVAATGITIADFEASKLAQNFRASDVTLNGSRVSAATDLKGAADYSQVTAGNQPLYSASGGPNGRPMIQLDDVNRYLTSSLSLAAPGTKPWMVYIIMRSDSWAVNKRIVTNSTDLIGNVQQGGSTPKVRTYNGTFGPASGSVAIGTWHRVAAYFGNTTADFIKVGSAAASSGINTGNSADASRLIGSATSSAIVSIAEVAYLYPTDAADAAAIISTLDTNYTDVWYGAGLT